MTRTTLHTVEPATRWEDALPLGNGSLGALVYGGICSETLVVNHETLWVECDRPDVPDMSGTLPVMRQLLKEGKWMEAAEAAERRGKEAGYKPGHGGAYHPSFNMRLAGQPTAPFSAYRRELDLAAGEARLAWEEGARTFQRNVFVSRADDLICLRYACSSPDITCAVNLQPSDFIEENAAFINRPINAESCPVAYTTAVHDSALSIEGRYRRSGLPFGGYARIVLPHGGRITPLTEIFSTQHRDSLTSGLRIDGADEIVIILKLYGPHMPETCLEAIRAQVDAMVPDYATLFTRHSDLHKAGYTRMTLDLGADDPDDRANEHLLLDAFQGHVSTDLVEKMFNFGRYLLLASSRPGGWPANLQGIWNGDYQPPWASDYHNDINVQMNYWAAAPGNLLEAMEAYFDFYEASLPDYRRNAETIYGCRGIVAPMGQPHKGTAHPPLGTMGVWTGGAGWLGQPFFDYWLFTGDDEFLRDRAIPYLEEVALFYEDFLFEDDGELVFSPSMSPENRPLLDDGTQSSFLSVNATMDVAIAREVLTNLCAGCKHLGIKQDRVAQWEAMLAKLPAYAVNEDGAMKEWLDPQLYDFYNHRHLSHLYPLFPGFEITKETHPEIHEACRIATEKRRIAGCHAQSGWSLAQLANIYARLNDGDRALDCIETLIRSSVGPNLFTYHNDWRHMGLTLFWNFKDRLFQIDANFGLTAAVLEMLVYSNRDIIGILPALPVRWPKGSFAGILCRGGAELDVSWDMTERALTVTLSARRTRTYTLCFPDAVASHRINGTGEVTASPRGNRFLCLDMQAGEQAVLHVQLA